MRIDRPAGLAMLFLAAARVVCASEPADDWWTRAAEEIRRSEYRIADQASAGLHAANRAQNLRAYFRRDGIEWIARTGDSPWKLRLALDEVWSAGGARVARDVGPEPEAASVLYRRGPVTERWTNTPGGFLLSLSLGPAHGAEPVTVLFAMSTDLEGISSADGSLGFYENGRRVLTLRPAHAGGPTRLTLEDTTLRVEREPSVGDGETVGDLEIDLVLAGVAPAASALPLSALPELFVESNQSSARLGTAVAPAGDVNGDGLSDLLVGAPRFDAGQVDEGRALLYLGRPDGPSDVPSWTAEINATGARFGSSLASAGDVNGDGFDDVVVGAPLYSDDQLEEGRVLLYLGSAAGLSSSPQWTADGNAVSARLGGSVAWAGDVNGDGLDDVIAGAQFFTNDQTAEGRAWVWAGSPGGLSAAPLWTAEGDEDFAELGTSVAAAGDVNADGFGDVIVGAPGAAGDEGRAYVYFGSAGGPEAVASWTAGGGDPAAAFGTAVGTAGDVDGDGYADVVVGAEFFGSPSRGRVFVFHGSADGPAADPSWFADGTQSNASFGAAVATAGDVNGDGYADLVVGAPLYDDDDIDEGRAQLYLGSATGLGAAPAWTADGDGNEAQFGRSVATAGDVDGDGLSDVIVGAPQFSNLQLAEGRAFLFVGAADGPALSPAWSATGSQSQELFGDSVGTAGDVNGDGYSDVLVGASLYDNGQNNEGAVFVFHGSAAGLSSSPDWSAESDEAGAAFGQSAAAAGDVNGDGFGDVIVGAPGFSDPEGDEGKIFVFLGSATGLGRVPAWSADIDEGDAELGTSVAGAGDVNGDGFGDLIAGAPTSSLGGAGGRAFVYLGSAAGPEDVPHWIGSSDVPNSGFGAAVDTAGDVNGDGFSDVVVGAPDLADTQAPGGRAFLYLGSQSGLSASPVWTADGPDFACSLGASVASAGDVNDDGFGDVIVGETCTSSSAVRGGRVTLYTGSKAGLGLLPAWSAQGDQTSSLFGASVDGAGDVNGDGFGDLLIGAPQRDGVGRVVLYLGSETTPGPGIAWSVAGSPPIAQLGDSVAGAGDVNGDGFRDILVGARFQGASFQGSAFAYYGNGAGGPSRRVRQLTSDGAAPIGPLGRSDSGTGFRLEALGRSAAGRTKLRQEAEVREISLPFDGVPTLAGDAVDSGPPGPGGSVVVLDGTVTGLTPGSFYRWRTRVASASPLFPHTTWISLPSNDVAETKLRTAGALPPSELEPIGPGLNEVVLPDSLPLPFSWNRGAAQRFRLEWSRNPYFSFAVESSDEIAAQPGGDVQVHRPDPDSWRRILRLARSPEIREIPIFWRVVPTDGGSPSVTRTIRMAIPQRPEITSPIDGAEFETTQAPVLSWEAHHNERFQVRFSSVEHLAAPRVIAGSAFEITETNWQTPAEVWSQIVELSRGGENGVVYYAVFARDSLDRTSWSEVRSLRVVGFDSPSEPLDKRKSARSRQPARTRRSGRH